MGTKVIPPPMSTNVIIRFVSASTRRSPNYASAKLTGITPATSQLQTDKR